MNLTIKNKSGETLDYSFNSGNAAHKRANWIVLLGHGVTGNKDRPVITDSAKALNEAGWDTLAFSFAGNGDSEGDFRAATITKECGDLQTVIDAVSPHYQKIAYVGHSMGSAVGVIQASRDTRIQALISLAGMVDTKTFAQTEFGNQTPDQGLMWEEECCPLSTAFMQDLSQTIKTILPQAEKINIPWLLLHGTADDVVLPKDTEQIKSLKETKVETHYINQADHSFNNPEHKKQMTEVLTTWLQKITGSKKL